MDLYFTILSYLNADDNVDFIEITSLHPNFDVLKQRAEGLKKKGFIEIRPSGVYPIGDGITSNEENLKKIFAKITFDGFEYLRLRAAR